MRGQILASLTALATLTGCSDFRRIDLDGPPDAEAVDRPAPPVDLPALAPDNPAPPSDTQSPQDLQSPDVPAPAEDLPAPPEDLPPPPRDVPPPPTDLGSPCPPGMTWCGRGCVDLGSDPAHCGACARPCPAGHLCASGSCSPTPPMCGALGRPCCPGSTCADGLVCGAGSCVAPCGGAGEPCCGSVCNMGFQCTAGRCQALPPMCSLREGEPCRAGAAAPGCCADGRSCAARDVVNTTAGFVCCHAQRGAPCTRDEGCCGTHVCNQGFCGPSAPACTAAGQPCTQDAACCGNSLGVRRCVHNLGSGPGPTCAQACVLHAECASGCCANLPGQSQKVCTHARLCGSSVGCTLPPGASCDRDSQCCGASLPAILTVCDRDNSRDQCARLCTVDTHCALSGQRCRPDSRGVYRCAGGS